MRAVRVSAYSALTGRNAMYGTSSHTAGVIAILDDAERLEWETLASHRRACVMFTDALSHRTFASEVDTAVATFEETGTYWTIAGLGLDGHALRRAVNWLTDLGMNHIEVWANPQYHRKVRTLLRRLSITAQVCGPDGKV